MTISDTLTVALVLVLLIGSIALYLYTRIQQAEQKLSLLEGILLDLKMSSEVKSYSELPAHDLAHDLRDHTDTYAPYEDAHELNLSMNKPIQEVDDVNESNENVEINIDQYKSVVSEAIESNVSYESMTLKELQSLAKSRGVSSSSMKKSQVIEALKAADVEPAPESGSFIETSITIEESK
jgi:hypothetical protein